MSKLKDLLKGNGDEHDDRRSGIKLEHESYRTSISLFEYHRDYLSENSVNLSDFVRVRVDEAMEDDGYDVPR
jgi:hypothetical protein